MPRDKDLKRVIRTRMQKTGESYTTARAQTLRKNPQAVAAPPAESAAVEPAHTIGAAPATAPDYAAVAGQTDVVIRNRTGRDWTEWLVTLDGLGAMQMTHTQIADVVRGQFNVPGWWAQSVTTGYERIRGLRDVRQRRGGDYEAGKSRTFSAPLEALYHAWQDDDVRAQWLTEPHTVRSVTPMKGIRIVFQDGTVAVVMLYAKGAKSNAVIAHTKLPDSAAVDARKLFWSERLDALGGLLTATAG